MVISEIAQDDRDNVAEIVVTARGLFDILSESFAITAAAPSAQLAIDTYVGRYGLNLAPDWEAHTEKVTSQVAAKAIGLMRARRHPTVSTFGQPILEAETGIDAREEMANLVAALREGGQLTGTEVGNVVEELLITDYQRLVFRQRHGSVEGYSSSLCRVLDGELISRAPVFRDGLFPAMRQLIAEPGDRLEARPFRLDTTQQTTLGAAFALIRAAHTSRPPHKM